jgi:hypothetical protein
MSDYKKWDKLNWLEESCSEHFINKTLVTELVMWMTEDDFEAFYDKLCRDWDIKRDRNDPKYDADIDSLDYNHVSNVMHY